MSLLLLCLHGAPLLCSAHDFAYTFTGDASAEPPSFFALGILGALFSAVGGALAIVSGTLMFVGPCVWRPLRVLLACLCCPLASSPPIESGASDDVDAPTPRERHKTHEHATRGAHSSSSSRRRDKSRGRGAT